MAVSQVQSGCGPAGLPCEHIRQCLCRTQRCTLQDLPLDIVVRVIAMAAPEVWQQTSCRHWEGREDLAHEMVPGPLTAAEQACARALLVHSSSGSSQALFLLVAYDIWRCKYVAWKWPV